MTSDEVPPARPTPIPIKKRIERVAGRAAMQVALGPLRALSLPAARILGSWFGVALYGLLGRYRRVARKNLALIYPELSPRERTRMARSVFRHFGRVAAEFIKLPELDREQVDAMAIVEGEENLVQALAANRGGFIITGHFGNWEFLARWLATHGYILNVVARDARDPAATKVMTDVRQGSGARVLYRGNSARAVLQSLKRGELVALLPDQNAADVFVPFLGISTGTVDGPAILHLKTRAPLIFSWCRRTEDNKFHITFEPSVVFEPTGDRSEDTRQVMTLINARLEVRIRSHPTQWLWLHDRWKATPWVFTGEMHETRTAAPVSSPERKTEGLNDSARS